MKKKIYLLLISVMFIFLNSYAQTSQEIKYGVKGGLNIANLHGDDTDNLDAVVRFHIGGFMELSLNENWTFQPEVLYSRQGCESNGVDLDLDYIAIPMMFKYYFNKQFNLEVGPQLNYTANAKVTTSFVHASIYNEKDFTMGINVGGGYTLNEHLGFSARYNYGFTDIFKDGDIKNHVIQFSVAYIF
ncbi:MAG: PorT family protein [Marinifilaceae bacterium]|jgi:hypothetical protein|nr:PorT family protein [Marinifilaceae bacterium]